jgi:hypothetical protein
MTNLVHLVHLAQSQSEVIYQTLLVCPLSAAMTDRHL